MELGTHGPTTQGLDLQKKRWNVVNQLKSTWAQTTSSLEKTTAID